MALFPITGLVGFQSSSTNTLNVTSDNYLVSCVSFGMYIHTWTQAQKLVEIDHAIFYSIKIIGLKQYVLVFISDQNEEQSSDFNSG